MNIEHVDICVGLAWGDEGKRKDRFRAIESKRI